MTGDCPDRAMLHKILLGQLTDSEAAQWETHLSECARCAELLREIDAEFSFSKFMRGVELGADHEVGVVRDLIGHLKNALPAALGQPMQEPMPTVGFGTTPADGEDEEIDFLKPSVPGELGRLGPYRILQKVGKGGMGMVFRAEDPKLHRSVALKVMLPKLVANEANRHRFLQEARSAAAVEHERIVTIYQVDEDNGVPYLAMQLLQGETLETRLQRQTGRLPTSFILRLGREIAEGLVEAAHRQGLIHRDIKPSNLWLQTDGDHVKILDFGLARISRENNRLTQTGMIVGTPGFLAPEQATGQPVDGRSDLFSLAQLPQFDQETP